jgi:hypothetical protein
VRRQSDGSSASSDPDGVARRTDPPSPHTPRPEPVHRPDPDLPADAKDIEELLASLSMLRLAMSAELSAAAGALDDQRPDVAADLVGGARSDLQKLRASVAKQRARQLTPALVAAEPPSDKAGSGNEAPPGTVPAPRRTIRRAAWQGRILVGALAVGLVLMVLPHGGGGGQSQQPSAATASQQATDVRLVSSEFTTLRQTLESKTPALASVMSAGQNWHTAVARTLPIASKQTSTATQIVELLREERALLATPAMRAPSMLQAALDLKTSADGLFTQLRALASEQVLAVLPEAITALPLPITSLAPSASPSTGTGVIPPPSDSPTTPPTAVQTPGTPSSPQPSLVAPNSPAPTTAPTVPSLPLPLPIPLPSLPALPGLIQHLTGLTGSQDTTGAVDQTLSSLGLGS